MFKVLVIAYYFPPLALSGVQRTLKFVKYFREYNWSATVITSGKVNYPAYDNSLLDEAIKADVEIIRTEPLNISKKFEQNGKRKLPSSSLMKIGSKISKTFFIPDSKKFWSKKAAKTAAALLKERTFDALFISVPPFSTVIPFLKLKEKYDLPLFIDYRDAWLNNQFRFYPTPYHHYKHKKLEDRVLRKVDRIIVVNRIIKEDLLKSYQFLDFKDIEIIPHGYDPADFQGVSEIPKDNNKLLITYSGIFYDDITPSYLLRAFKQLTKELPDVASNIELQFIGFFKKENRKLVKKMKLESFVKEIGYINHPELIKHLISTDVLWLMLPNSEKMRNVTPSKLFEYFAARKPIIASLPEGAAKLNAEKYAATFVTKPDDISEIKNTLVEVHEKYLKGDLPKPDENFISNFNRLNQTEQLIKIFQFYLKEE